MNQVTQLVRRDSARDGLAAGALALFVLALYAQLLFTNRVPASGDILFYFYPYRALAADALRNGALPLWNPYIFMGAPFLANPQAAALYPLHWPLIWLPATQQVFWSAALHTWLLGVGGYALMRAWRIDRGSSLIAGLTLAGSGFNGGLLGHLNQMNGAAWLPWAACVLARAYYSLEQRGDRPTAVWMRQSALPAAGLLSLLVALMLLAGHTQTVYINLFGLGAWLLATGAWAGWRARRDQAESTKRLWPAGMGLAILAVGCVAGVATSAAQLLPTLELSGLGLRSGGLSYAEASSFSLQPLSLAWTLLPSYGLVDLGVVFDTLGYSEFVAYMGALGLLLAGWGVWRARGAFDAAWGFGLFFAGLGLFLALGRWNPVYFILYQLIPGFDLFRAPARWMMLYTLGMAMLAGLGASLFIQHLARRHARWAQIGLALLILGIAVDLLVAARALPHTHPTAPQAVYDVRTAPAHLLTDPRRDEIGPGAMGRFLSMSTITFDPGDMADYRRIFAQGDTPILDKAAFNDLIVALKAQEILAPNLAMLWQIPGVDGFDGGTLPLQRYNDFLTLLIPPDALVPDGRVREQLQRIPPSSLLSLLNVQYVITDKVQDLWYEGVYYDRQLGATLSPLASEGAVNLPVEVPQAFPATHVDIIGYVTLESEVNELAAANVAVLEMTVMRQDAPAETHEILAGGQPGAHLADDRLDSPLAEQSGATVAYRDVENERQEYRVRLALTNPGAVDELQFAPRTRQFSVTIQAVTLYDARTGMFLALTPSDEGRFRLVHSGDVKVYEHLDGLPRAYLVYHAEAVADPDAALARLADPAFDPATSAVIETVVEIDALPAEPDPRQGQDTREGRVEMVAYTPETVTLRVETDSPALLVLSDVYYPGWRAWIDGRATPIYRANYLFRGIVTPPGAHTVVFRFEPASLRRGFWLSGLGLVALVVMLAARGGAGRSTRSVRSPNLPDV